ncbi:MAG: SDR family NAD(P)-dependent oxidoreductase [Chloroflexota bacterium]|nr:SDR family NAD(P)-dependent oxidoreductase [Chloroflexota bacterium]
MRLEGKTALITGASKGIGRAIALAYAREGAHLAVTARATDELESLRREAESFGVRCVAVTADLAEEGAVDVVYSAARDALGPIQILVNNAGVGSSANPKPVVNYDDDFWNLLLYVNLTVPYLLCKRVLPDMLAAKYGRIVNVASINGKIGSFHGAAYAASKHGLLGLTRTLAMEVVGDGITVNAICPGPVHTLINDIRIAYDAERLGITVEEIEKRMTPMGRRLEADEVAPLAVYLAGEESATMTGQAINIDGGVLMTG